MNGAARGAERVEVGVAAELGERQVRVELSRVFLERDLVVVAIGGHARIGGGGGAQWTGNGQALAEVVGPRDVTQTRQRVDELAHARAGDRRPDDLHRRGRGVARAGGRQGDRGDLLVGGRAHGGVHHRHGRRATAPAAADDHARRLGVAGASARYGDGGDLPEGRRAGGGVRGRGRHGSSAVGLHQRAVGVVAHCEDVRSRARVGHRRQCRQARGEWAVQGGRRVHSAEGEAHARLLGRLARAGRPSLGLGGAAHSSGCRFTPKRA